MDKQIDFLEVLKEKKEPVWQEIKSYLDQLNDFPDYCQVPDKYSSELDFHQEIVSEYPSRLGKYVRPSLVLLTASAMGYPEKKAIRTAAAMEISENWILNHDDFEDNSLERRGKPCLHRIVSPELAVNAGDALHILQWKVIHDNQEILGKEKTLKIMNEFYHLLNRTALGQTIEIKWTQQNKSDLKDEDVLFILESKTGYYTIGGPMRLGAILAGANKEQLAKLYEFGKLAGYCYQIQDDLLDLTSDFEGLKEQRGNDIYEGKRTVMLLHLLRNVDQKDKQKINKILSKSREEKDQQEVDWVIRKMKEYGSLKHGRELLTNYIEQAQDYLNTELAFLTEQPAVDQIKAFITFLEEREF
jgi:geranylgeranyl diphosphate synthase type II